MPQITVTIKWNKPKDPFFLTEKNIGAALNLYCTSQVIVTSAEYSIQLPQNIIDLIKKANRGNFFQRLFKRIRRRKYGSI